MIMAMLGLSRISKAFRVMTDVASAEPFDEVTIGLPMPSFEDAVAW